MDKPKVGTPFDWEDWEQYAKTRSPMRWRLFGVPSKVLGRLRTWLRRGRHHA